MQVVKILKGDDCTSEIVGHSQQHLMLRRAHSEELFDAEEYNKTMCLDDLDRHMEIVLGTCNDV